MNSMHPSHSSDVSTLREWGESSSQSRSHIYNFPIHHTEEREEKVEEETSYYGKGDIHVPQRKQVSCKSPCALSREGMQAHSSGPTKKGNITVFATRHILYISCNVCSYECATMSRKRNMVVLVAWMSICSMNLRPSIPLSRHAAHSCACEGNSHTFILLSSYHLA